MCGAVVDSGVTDGLAARQPRRRGVGGLWWQRDFRLLWIGETTSKLGSAVTYIAMPLVAVLTLQASTFMVGLLEAVAWLPWLVVGLPAGAWVDRLPRRPIMLACNLASLVLLASVPVAAWCGVLTIGQLLAVALITGTASVFFSTAYQAYLPAVVAREDLAEGNAKLQGSEAAAQVVGPGLGGVIAQLFGAVAGLLADAVSFGVSALCLLGIRTREAAANQTSRGRPRTSLRHEIIEGLRFVVRDPYLRVITAFAGATNLASNVMLAIVVVFLVRTVGVSPGGVGALSAAASCGGVVGAMVATRIARRFGTARGLLMCEMCAALFGLLVPLTTEGPGLAWFIVGGLLRNAGIVAFNVIIGSFRQTYCPPALLGRVTACSRFVVYGTIPLGALLAGILGTTVGLRETVWIGAVASTVSALVLLAGPLRRDRDLPTQPGPLAARSPSAGPSDH